MGACANHRDVASASPRGRAHLAFPLPELESDRRERFFARDVRSHARFPASPLPSEQVSLATRSTSAAPPVASRSPGARRGSECTSRARSAREPTRPGSFPARPSFLGLRGLRAGFARRDRPEAHASRPRSPPRAHPPVLEVLRTLTDPSPRLSSRYELGRQPANTKLSSHPDVRVVRCRGGNRKFRALRLDTGNFSWGSENTTHKTRILDVTYNASNNELVRRRTPSRAFPVPGVRRARSGCDGRRANATERSTRERRLPRLVSPLPRSLTARARR